MIDVDDDNDVDLIVFGKKEKYGIKFAGVGHDGSKVAKKEYLEDRAKSLKNKGFYGEVSEVLAEILLKKYNVPVVDDQEEVR